MAKCLFEWHEYSLWNIECGNTKYIHWSSCEYPPGYCFSGWMSVSGVTIVPTKKYLKKLAKVKKLVDIMTSALAVFKISISKALNDGRVDEQGFTKLQTFYLGQLNELANIVCKMEAETRAQLQKAY